MEERLDVTEQQTEAAGAKKTLGVIKNIAVWTLFAVTMLIMVFTLISSILFNTDSNDKKGLFGLKFYVVLSDSMKEDASGGKGYFAAGDVIVCKEVDPKTLKPGDVITFMSSNDVTSNEEKATYGKFGATITHKIREVTTDEKGRPCFVTYGTTTGKDDMATVSYGDVYAKYAFKIPFAGYFFNFVKTTPGYIVCILIPFLLIIVLQIMNFVKVFRKYRAEQMNEMREERSKLEEDKKANEKMMEELLALKAELERARSGEPIYDPNESIVEDIGDGDEQTSESDAPKPQQKHSKTRSKAATANDAASSEKTSSAAKKSTSSALRKNASSGARTASGASSARRSTAEPGTKKTGSTVGTKKSTASSAKGTSNAKKSTSAKAVNENAEQPAKDKTSKS